MRTNIFLTTLLILSMALCYAGCKEKNESGSMKGTHRVTYQGFSFLCPDELKPAEQFGGSDTAPNLFALSGVDIANAIYCDVSDAKSDFTPEAGQQLLESLKSGEPSAEGKVLKDGIEVRAGKSTPETSYTAMRIFVHGRKACTLTFTYTEKNKDTLGKYVDAVLNSIQPAE